MKPEDLSEIIPELNDSLKQIKSFSEKHKIKHFTKYFDNALETLRSKGKIKHSYHRDLVPAGILSAEAEMILNVCQSAWVFGGMGWWNDMSFEGEDQETYIKVSDKLYQAIDQAIVAAVSSSFYSK